MRSAAGTTPPAHRNQHDVLPPREASTSSSSIDLSALRSYLPCGCAASLTTNKTAATDLASLFGEYENND